MHINAVVILFIIFTRYLMPICFSRNKILHGLFILCLMNKVVSTRTQPVSSHMITVVSSGVVNVHSLSMDLG